MGPYEILYLVNHNTEIDLVLTFHRRSSWTFFWAAFYPASMIEPFHWLQILKSLFISLICFARSDNIIQLKNERNRNVFVCIRLMLYHLTRWYQLIMDICYSNRYIFTQNDRKKKFRCVELFTVRWYELISFVNYNFLCTQFSWIQYIFGIIFLITQALVENDNDKKINENVFGYNLSSISLGTFYFLRCLKTINKTLIQYRNIAAVKMISFFYTVAFAFTSFPMFSLITNQYQFEYMFVFIPITCYRFWIGFFFSLLLLYVIFTISLSFDWRARWQQQQHAFSVGTQWRERKWEMVSDIGNDGLV